MNAVVTEQDRLHLARALELAERGRGRVNPNPLVGAVIVSPQSEVIGEGWHAELGAAHAERAALEDCRTRGEDPAGATVYVTLEPCAHHGRQPPCAEALVAAGVGRVVYASDDPSEKANGRGPGVLRDEGIDVVAAEGAEAAAARRLNQAFRKHARTGRPLVILKSAMTLDGRTATPAGDSRWISGDVSRALVHRWRAEADAVAVGIGTALADDPLLTVRDADPGPKQPIRIVFDSAARLPLDSQLLASLDQAPVIVVVSPAAPADRLQELEAAGAEAIVADGDAPDRVRTALAELGRREITAVLLEGGATLAGAFRDAGELDELRLFIAPLLLGGAGSRPLLTGQGPSAMADAQRALAVKHERSGDDLLITARMREW